MDSVSFIQSFKFLSREGKRNPNGSMRLASRAEIMRWMDQGAIRVNGERLRQETIDFPLFSVILFPKGDRVTLL